MLRVCSLFVLLLAAGLAPRAGLADFSGPIRVIDGDTIDVGDVRVRIHGIDAVEVGQTCRTEQGRRWDCGTFVKQTLRDRYTGVHAKCKTMDIDKYKRVVAKCFVGNQDIGAQLVREGLALAYRKYSWDYDQIEVAAAAGDKGLWAGTMQNPAVARRQTAVGRIPPDANCTIKGNISSGGYIYHMPGDAFYERTGIRVERGEQWFCSAQDAEAAGWRRARR